MGPQSVRVFVAMPGSTMGERARWANIEEIKRKLLQPVTDRIGEKMGCEAQLVIEKDKVDSVPIHPSMFREAVDADVYIADLTGANANVYLELGVRWALRDHTTILIAQDVKVEFNVSGNRVIPYGPMPDELELAVSQITAAALTGLQNPELIDNPVRAGLSLVTILRTEWDGLRQEIARLKELQADELVAAALKLPAEQKIEKLRLALERNPVNVRAHFELGIALRKAADYEEAVRELQVVVSLDASHARGWRELGVALSKSGQPEQLADASAALQRAVELNPDDDEAWANLGGLQRRRARTSANPLFDWGMLREARDAYRHASRIRGNDTYPLVNAARIDLLLSANEPETRETALAELKKLRHLAQFEVVENPDDPWKRFDHADTLLLTGRVEDGLAELRAGINLIEPLNRTSYLTSVIEPLQDFLDAGVLDQIESDGVRTAIEINEQEIRSAEST
jgi:tetratricopeptide (TPR) repeat protein